MHEWHIQARNERGREIAERFKERIKRKGQFWLVPSSKSRKRRYRVKLDPTNVYCSCPDHQETGERCKHIFAVEHLIRGREEAGNSECPAPPPSKAVTPGTKRNWREYNEMQTNEEDEFEPLLYQICHSITEPHHHRGRRPVPLAASLFAATTKVYLTKSARRVMPRLDQAHREGFLPRPVTFSTIAAFLEREDATKVLCDLITRSSLPVVGMERVFAADSTGFAGSRFVNWRSIKYRGMYEHVWAKMHIMAGIKTHIITAAIIKERDAADLGQLPELLRTTAQNFKIEEVVADKVYNTAANQQAIADLGARAFIPFKSSHTGRRGGLWKQKFDEWHEDLDYSLEQYHQRVQVETVFSMIKTKFGDNLRSKTDTAMKNEALCKALCHNIYCLIRLIRGRKITTEFLLDIFERNVVD